VEGSYLVIVEKEDQTTISAILEDIDYKITPYPQILQTLEKILQQWGALRVEIVNEYIRDRRNADAFLHDFVAFGKYLSSLPQNCEILVNDVNDGKILMHNRIITQLLHYYYSIGCKINPKPANRINGKVHDFDVGNFRCEVKTIQGKASIQGTNLGHRFNPSFAKTLLAGIKDDLDEAEIQVGKDGIIILAPWSHKINSIFRKYFENKLSNTPPKLQSNLTIFVLTSDKAFEDYYVSIPTSKIREELDSMMQNIQTNCVRGLSFAFIRDGLRLRLGTAPIAGSSVAIFYDPEKD